MLFTVAFLSQVRAARVTARSSGFPWQCHHLPLCCLQRGTLSDVVPNSAMLFLTSNVARCSGKFRYVVCNIRCCRMLHRNLPMLFATCQLVRCHACLCPACWQHRHVSGHRKSPRKIRSPAGCPYFRYFPP